MASSGSNKSHARSDAAALSADWFISAIQSDGSVGDCLKVVIAELDAKKNFVLSLTKAIAERSVNAPDALTDLGQRLRLLENTLRFRLTILSPERKGAWFRPSSATTGPFKENLLSEPVFSAYDELQHARVRMGLSACWEKRNLMDYPMKSTEPTLWKYLLSLNFELESIDKLAAGFPRLSEMPEMLPDFLESRSLRAFLTNVRAEISSLRNRLGDSYKTLLDASERYWRHHATVTSQRDHRPLSGNDGRPSEFKGKRTSTTSRPRYKSSSDIEALKFMGFPDYPNWDDLKQRYHALALDMHPDRPSGNEQRFKMLTKSYKHLAKVCRS